MHNVPKGEDLQRSSHHKLIYQKKERQLLVSQKSTPSTMRRQFYVSQKKEGKCISSCRKMTNMIIIFFHRNTLLLTVHGHKPVRENYEEPQIHFTMPFIITLHTSFLENFLSTKTMENSMRTLAYFHRHFTYEEELTRDH